MSAVTSVPDRGWCPECKTSAEVIDRFVEDTGDSRTTVTEYTVTVLSCGHTVERTIREYPSPLRQAGAPPAWYAGDPFLGEGR